MAAGSATRLGKFTKKTPKGLLDINGISLLERIMNAFSKNGITDFVIIIGPNSEEFSFKNVTYIHDRNYHNHDVLGSLMAADDILTNDVIISYTDIVYDESIVKAVLDFSGDIGLAIDMNWEDAYIGRTEHPIDEAANVLIKNNSVLRIGHDKSRFGKFTKDEIGEFLGIMKLSKTGSSILRKRCTELKKSHKGPFHEAISFEYSYITDILQDLIDLGVDVKPIKIKGKWCEIDTPQDLERAKKIFR